MPRGSSPKIYPEEMVEAVRSLYADGLNQTEIAEELRTSQKVIWNLMRRHGIRARRAAKRDQRGPLNDSWRGSKATYAALHTRVVVVRGRPARCERCGVSGSGRRYEWANLTGRYDDPEDYERMCVPCHRRYDHGRRREGVMPPCPPKRATG